MLCVMIGPKNHKFYSFFELSSDGNKVKLPHGCGWVSIQDFFTYQIRFNKRDVYYID